MDRTVFLSVEKYFYLMTIYIFSGAVASMFWIDDELGVDIYLDGKFKEEFCFQVKYYGMVKMIFVHSCCDFNSLHSYSF